LVDELELVAGLAADQENFEQAARLFAAVDAARATRLQVAHRTGIRSHPASRISVVGRRLRSPDLK